MKRIRAAVHNQPQKIVAYTGGKLIGGHSTRFRSISFTGQCPVWSL